MAMMSSGVWLIDDAFVDVTLCDEYVAAGGYGPDGFYVSQTHYTSPTNNNPDGCPQSGYPPTMPSCVYFAQDPKVYGTNNTKSLTPYVDDHWLKQPADAMNLLVSKYGFPSDSFATIYNESIACQGMPPPQNNVGDQLALTLSNCFWNVTVNYTSWSPFENEWLGLSC
jgi:hypothetical protein